jgi:hypothetical protein
VPTATPTPTLDPSTLIHVTLPYPNPAKQDLVTFYYQLSMPADLVAFKLYTVAFRKVASFAGTTFAGENKVIYNLTGLANGLYYYVIDADTGGNPSTGSGQRHERKIGKLIVAR